VYSVYGFDYKLQRISIMAIQLMHRRRNHWGTEARASSDFSEWQKNCRHFSITYWFKL